MHRKRPQVLGVDLNRSEWAGTRSCARGLGQASPEVLESVRRQLRVANRVLDVFVAQPRLQRPGIVAGIG
jgi:hypothetical protein